MNSQSITSMVVGVVLLSAGNACARDPGDVDRGRALALQSCASCHAIDRSAGLSRDPRAMAFPRLAQIRGMTAVALRAALQTSHKAMPNLVLRKREREDVIAYILSFKDRDAAKN
jgi:mono/diheme cytochrome c family protein